MRKCFAVSLALIAILFVVPWALGTDAPEKNDTEWVETELPGEIVAVDDKHEEEKAETVESGEIDGALTLSVLIGGQAVQMDMGTYLVGVVRAEMPASFEQEALKAQAVAARTYTLHKMENGGSENHPGVDACDDITCCKAYMDGGEGAAAWGEKAVEYEEKIRAAVRETDGECVLYGGVPALTVFHSSSPERTMDAQDVWSAAVPYLVSVESPESAETVPNYHSTAAFEPGVLKSILLAALPNADLTAPPTDWFTNIHQKENGTVTALDVGGVTVKGGEIREILGLRSAAFTISFEEERVAFSVTGYGHGVGMSQYGANVLASEGADYRAILGRYYPGTAVEQYTFSRGTS